MHANCTDFTGTCGYMHANCCVHINIADVSESLLTTCRYVYGHMVCYKVHIVAMLYMNTTTRWLNRFMYIVMLLMYG